MKTRFLLTLLCLLLTSGTVAAAEKPVCLTADKLTNQMTPLDLYASYEVCLRQGRKQDAGYLFFVAAAYGMYDTQRVPDKTTHEVARNVIKASMQKQTSAEQAAFATVLKEMMAAPPQMFPVCQKIFALGPPMYAPVYMAGENGAYLKTEEMDVPLIWLTSLGATTRCPVKNLQLNKTTFKP